MRSFLVIIMLLTAIADSCLAESVSVSDESKSQISASYDGASAKSGASKSPCGVPESRDSNGESHQCHLGHCGFILDSQLNIAKFDTPADKIPYLFALPSYVLSSRKRPPKTNA